MINICLSLIKNFKYTFRRFLISFSYDNSRVFRIDNNDFERIEGKTRWLP